MMKKQNKLETMPSGKEKVNANIYTGKKVKMEYECGIIFKRMCNDVYVVLGFSSSQGFATVQDTYTGKIYEHSCGVLD